MRPLVFILLAGIFAAVVLLWTDEVEGRGHTRKAQERQVLIEGAKKMMLFVATLEKNERTLLKSARSQAELKVFKSRLKVMEARMPDKFRQCYGMLKKEFRRQKACEYAFFGMSKQRSDTLYAHICELSMLGVVSKCYTEGLFDPDEIK